MAFNRTGTCNRCGECCGYPRATDGGQNNPWPLSWPDSVRTWTLEVLGTELPMFRATGHPALGGRQSGNFRIGNNTFRWCWAQGGGLATDVAPYNDGGATFDIRCPLLMAKQPDGTVPCGAYGQTQTLPGSTQTFHQMWEKLCEPTPPYKFETQSQVDNWFINCPSCSYVYVAE